MATRAGTNSVQQGPIRESVDAFNMQAELGVMNQLRAAHFTISLQKTTFSPRTIQWIANEITLIMNELMPPDSGDEHVSTSED